MTHLLAAGLSGAGAITEYLFDQVMQTCAQSHGNGTFDRHYIGEMSLLNEPAVGQTIKPGSIVRRSQQEQGPAQPRPCPHRSFPFCSPVVRARGSGRCHAMPCQSNILSMQLAFASHSFWSQLLLFFGSALPRCANSRGVFLWYVSLCPTVGGCRYDCPGRHSFGAR